MPGMDLTALIPAVTTEDLDDIEGRDWDDHKM